MTLELPCHAVLPLRDAQAWRVACHDGALWLTQEGDRYDVIIEAGKEFRVSRAGKTLIVALRASRFSLLGPQSAQLSVMFSSRTSLPSFS